MKSSLRALVITISALLAVFTTLATVPAQAASPATRSVSTADVRVQAITAKRKADLDFGWSGWSVNFNKTETRGIAAGTGSCSVVVGKLPSVQSKVISALCGLMTVYAGYVLSGGNCLRVHIYYWGSPSIGSWNC